MPTATAANSESFGVSRSDAPLSAPPPPSYRAMAGRVTGGPLALKIDGRVQLIDPESIDWVEADDDHVVVHCGERAWRSPGRR